MTLYDFFAFLGATLVGVGILYLLGVLALSWALPSNRSIMSHRDYRSMVGSEFYEKETKAIMLANEQRRFGLSKSVAADYPLQPDNCSDELRAFYKTLPKRTPSSDEKLGLNGGN